MGQGEVDASVLDDVPLLAGRYRITALLGTGGMGSVYRAIDELLDEVVAVKVLRGTLESLADTQRRLLREVKLARRVTHRNVVRTFDVGVHDGLHFFSMEFVDGVSLSHVRQVEGLMDAKRAAALGVEIARGLAASHEAAVVHADLKPANVLCAPDRIVLTDFGVARAFGRNDRVDGVSDSSDLGGTLTYMAPEQLVGAPIDGRADVYSLGCILFQLVTGRLPWPRGSEPLARTVVAPPDPRELVPDLSPELTDVILRCLSTRPGDRYPNADAAAEALLVVSGGASSPAPRAYFHARTAARSVAVLPLANAGVMWDDYLAFGLAEHITDDLSRHATLGVRPFAASYDAARSGQGAVATGRALGVDVVVDGTLARTGHEVTLTVRMTSVGDGFQILAWRATRDAAEVATLATDAATVLAEALMVEEPPREALTGDTAARDLYLRGRYTFATSYYGVGEAIPLLRAAYERSPHDTRIASTYALALIRHVRMAPPSPDGHSEVRRIVVETADRHPEAPDAQTALGALAFEDGDYRSAALALARALTLAPRHAPALDWCSRMLLDFGRPEWAYELLCAAREQDPSLVAVDVMLARARFVLGDREGALALLRRRTTPEDTSPLHWAALSRLVLWSGDRDLATYEHGRFLRAVAETAAPPGPTWGGIASEVERRLRLGRTGLLADDEAESVHRGLVESGIPRRDAHVLQLGIEVLAAARRFESVLRLLPRLERAAFVDVTWIDRCPLLEPLHTHTALHALRASASARVAPALDILERARVLFEPSHGAPPNRR
ncbi:MAG: protein kinase [Myxococcales bacterium]|nr:protein kinase [Myxococcales bacterium]